MNQSTNSQPSHFLSYMKEVIDQMESSGRKGSARNYNSAYLSLRRFRKGRDIRIKKFNASLVESYNSWLIERGILRNSISFYMRILRSVYNKAVKEGLVNQTYPFEKVYTGIDRTRKRSLAPDVLKQLIELDLNNNWKLVLARDIFLFGVYTRGMAFVDIAHLKNANIRGNEIVYCRRKTGQTIIVRIEKEMENIIKKYELRTRHSRYVFPILKDTKDVSGRMYYQALSTYNYRLKKIQQMLGLSMPLTSYIARHTWASLAHRMSIPLAIISQGMGHSSQKTTEIYISELEETIIHNANRSLLDSLNP